MSGDAIKVDNIVEGNELIKRPSKEKILKI